MGGGNGVRVGPGPGTDDTHVVHFPAILLPEVAADEGRGDNRQWTRAPEVNHLAAEDGEHATPQQHQHPHWHHERLASSGQTEGALIFSYLKLRPLASPRLNRPLAKDPR
jgi:hypothetical protein